METIKHKVDQQKFDELIQKDKPTPEFDTYKGIEQAPIPYKIRV